MAAVNTTVIVTNANMETLSRKDMLLWVNKNVNGNYKKIEELCSGVAYCQMMEQLFPDCIGDKKIRKEAKLQHEQLHNLRLLQKALMRVKCDKEVPIDLLLKGRFLDNFEFLQWFKKFYDTMSSGKENIPNNVPKSNMVAKTPTFPVLKVKDQESCQKETPKELPSTLTALKNDVHNLQVKMENVKTVRDFYHKKLAVMETVLQSSLGHHEHENFCNRALNIIYGDKSDNALDSKLE